MDKHEYKHLVDEIQYLIDQQEYAKAAEIADTIDWRRVRSVMTLGTISDLYRINKRYEDARDIMLMAYDRKPENSQVCYSLCELFLKTGEMADAVEFYKEYERLTTPDDSGRYILQYKMYEANNVSLEERAEVLENLRQRGHYEKWLYELAYLYHRMELETKCVEVCDELILWFGTGEYVNKALELKRLHAPLTPEQQAKYDRRFEPAEYEAESAPEENGPEENVWEGEQDTGEILEESEQADPADATRVFDVEEVRRQTGEFAAQDTDTAPMVKIMDVGQYNTLNLQAEIAAGVNEVLETDSITRTLLQPMINPETGYYDIGTTTEILDNLSRDTDYMENSEVYFGETGELQLHTGEISSVDGAMEGYASEGQFAEDGTMEGYASEGQFAEDGAMEGYASEGQFADDGAMEGYASEGQFAEDGAVEDYASEGQFAEEGAMEGYASEGQFAEDGAVEGYASEGQFAEDGAMEDYASADQDSAEIYEDDGSGSLNPGDNVETSDYREEDDLLKEAVSPEKSGQESPDGEKFSAREEASNEAGEVESAAHTGVREENVYGDSYAGYVEDDPAAERADLSGASIADRVMEQMRVESLEAQKKLENEALTAQPPEPMARALTQEPDGQIRLVVPEGKKLEKQITGQLSIEDIRAEWERMKQESREKQEEEVRQRVLRQTGKMFTEFEEALRDNILKQMEKKEDSSLYELQGSPRTNDGQETGEAGEDDGWAMDEWTSETGGLEAEGEFAEAEDTFAETQEDFVELEEATEEFEESFGEPEEVPEETEELTEEMSEEMPEATEEAFEEMPEEMSEATEEAFEEMPEEMFEEAEETPEEMSEATEESPEEVLEEAEETFEDDLSSEGYEELPEATLTGDSWEDDEYPDFTAEETAPEPENEEAAKESKEMSADEAAEEISEEDQAEPESDEKDSQEETDKDENAQGGPEEKQVSAAQTSDAPSVRSLTEEEETLFGELVQGRSTREQLVKAIDSISMAAYAGNMVITSEENSSALEMAKNIVREIKQTDSNFSGNAARISGRKMNGKKISEILEQLKNGAMIIDNASQLSEETLTDLYKCMQQDSYGLLVILIDTKKKMNLFLKEHKKFVPMFGARVDLLPLSNDVLAEYAQQYAREKEFSIDDLGMLALHTRIDEMQTARHSVTKAEIEGIMDAAIESAAKKNVGHFFDILLGRRYDDEDMIIITEKDFE